MHFLIHYTVHKDRQGHTSDGSSEESDESDDEEGSMDSDELQESASEVEDEKEMSSEDEVENQATEEQIQLLGDMRSEDTTTDASSAKKKKRKEKKMTAAKLALLKQEKVGRHFLCKIQDAVLPDSAVLPLKLATQKLPDPSYPWSDNYEYLFQFVKYSENGTKFDM